MSIEDRINKRLVEIGLEDYSWDISEIDDPIIQELLKEQHPNSVYLVCNYDGEDTQILEIFDSYTKAQAYVSKCEAEEDAWLFYDNLYISRREVK